MNKNGITSELTLVIDQGIHATRALAFDAEGIVEASAHQPIALKRISADVPQAADARDALQYAGAEFGVQNLGEVRTIFHDYLQRAFNDEMSAEEAMAAAQAEAEAALEAFR